MNFAPSLATGVCPARSVIEPVYEAHARTGRLWPGGEGFDLRSLLSESAVDGVPDAVERMPTFFHPFSAADVARACEGAGFQVVLAREAWHPGYPPPYRHDGRENAQVMAVR